MLKKEDFCFPTDFKQKGMNDITQEITLFYLSNCPYCRKAFQLIEELKEEHPELAAIPIRLVILSEPSARSRA